MIRAESPAGLELAQQVSASGRAWSVAPVAEDTVTALATALPCHPTVARLLCIRGVTDVDVARQFLKPSLNTLSDPDTIPDIDEAVALIEGALAAHDPICIYGDYDVDGVTGTAILSDVLEHLGGQVSTYIPHRLREGYGLNKDAIRRIAESGSRLLITVDGGSNDLEELELAQSLGMQVIVTDHHLIHGDLPSCPVVHPGRTDAAGAFAGLAGVGVAYKLAWALGRSRSGTRKVADDFRELMLSALSLVAMGTVADVVPLVGENRALVHYGLRAFPRLTERPGIQALLAVCGLDSDAVTSEGVGFRLAPHLNAAGRLGRAEDSLELLLTRDGQRGEELAQQLATANRRRKEIETEMLAECERLAGDEISDSAGALVCAHEDFHSGVAGIVAARLVDKYHRPVFVIALNNDDVGRGSIRSPDEIPLDPYYERAREHVVSIGGHACAGGVAVRPEAVAALREVLATTPLPDVTQSQLAVDAILDPGDVTVELARALASLEPHGKGNPSPRFALTGLRLAGAPRLVGKGEEHLSFSIRGQRGGAPLKAIYFRGAPHATRLATTEEPFSVVAEILINTFTGTPRAEIRVVDLATS
ncbi:MAG: single-stranded-DNA-specific exonuclease RecJ [Planctomycetota bacterium]